MAVFWPLVKAWLVETVPTLPGLEDVVTTNGVPVGEQDPDRYMTVGWISISDDNGGEFHRDSAYDGSVWQETGAVRSEIVAQGGDSDPTLTEQAAIAIAEAIDAAIQAELKKNQPLGCLSPEATVVSVFQVNAISNERGIGTALLHQLQYTTSTIPG